ncbi:hypothetical protein Drorol1_Dr00013258, partial [Drosera rotundifolia]
TTQLYYILLDYGNRVVTVMYNVISIWILVSLEILRSHIKEATGCAKDDYFEEVYQVMYHKVLHQIMCRAEFLQGFKTKDVVCENYILKCICSIYRLLCFLRLNYYML